MGVQLENKENRNQEEEEGEIQGGFIETGSGDDPNERDMI
jgi:hypothetical protein